MNYYFNSNEVEVIARAMLSYVNRMDEHIKLYKNDTNTAMDINNKIRIALKIRDLIDKNSDTIDIMYKFK